MLRSSSGLGGSVSSLCAGLRPDRERNWILGPVSAKHRNWMGLACPQTVQEEGHLLCGSYRVHGRSCCRVHQPGQTRGSQRDLGRSPQL